MRRLPTALALLTVLLCAGTLGCTHPIDRRYRSRAIKGLTVADVQSDPGAYEGSTVVWGGMVLETANRQEQSEMVVLQTPLGYSGYPASAEQTRGRFLARTPRFLDPEAYCHGAKVTLAGEITGTAERAIGEKEYLYPVIRIEQLHLWGDPEPAGRTGYYGYGAYYPRYHYFGPYRHYPYYGHFGHRFHY